MTDPHIPVERGLRATVRMAAGINIGDGDGEDGDTGVVTRLRALVPATAPLLRPLHDLRGRLAAIDTELRAAMLRHGAIGAAVGAAIVCCGFATLAIEARAKATPAPEEIAVLAVEPIAKADRLAPNGGKGAAIASANDRPAGPGGDLTITTPGPAEGTTLAMPALAYASADLRASAVAAIDRVLDAPPIAAPTLSPRPVGSLAEEEEDDEEVVPLVLPMPRSRPQVAAIESVPLPIPRPRPLVLASLTPPERSEAPPGLAEAPPDAPAAPRAVEPAARPSGGGILGFFSSPTEPVKAPPKIKLDTPFGVPYVLQSGSVETACLKPDLVEILRHIEGHYGQKVVITSGFRDRGRQGSLHRQCAAADIQVSGVPAAKLASFARTIPGIGGVGTYCHPSMIHVDTGTPRDWKYGCGSFFAMRGGQGHWGKTPGALAKVQSETLQAANAEAAED